jgi:hypothetical protein
MGEMIKTRLIGGRRDGEELQIPAKNPQLILKLMCPTERMSLDGLGRGQVPTYTHETYTLETFMGNPVYVHEGLTQTELWMLLIKHYNPGKR